MIYDQEGLKQSYEKLIRLGGCADGGVVLSSEVLDVGTFVLLGEAADEGLVRTHVYHA